MDNFKSISRITVLGLAVAFFGPPLIIYIASQIAPDVYTNIFLVKKELLIFGITGLLILLIYRGEKLDLKSIGLHGRHWGKSILHGLVLSIVLLVVVILTALALSIWDIPVGGSEVHKYKNITLWTWTLIVLRAGVVEEICYRGYIMERLEKWTGNWYIYFLMPAVFFSLLHYSQGIAGIAISLVAGLILAYWYWKKRDLKANIMAHFLVDLTPNVLLPLLGFAQ
ncbi:CPBP family intramembrane glutamic endopeptidase [Flagellimonas myxillae]|uniref:CPBP family intramembrane glutamic endopeptidase n=1 Tax=Flagellimonas myxillae TaxID=2942214 RepID=UPI00201F4E9F|nr:CPBP family intramembrane glutamic endopeptidase [Muricauda myxillae]MCL6267677.1 CPBP family intramembrane metalloprotease [Muricauda myxillae]